MNVGIDTSLLVAVEVVQHPRHAAAKAYIDSVLDGGGRLALTPDVWPSSCMW